MTNSLYGMAFDDRGVTNIPPAYTTARDRLQIDLNNKAKLFDVVDTDAGIAATVTSGFVFEETLLSIHHGLGYIPQVYTALTLFNKGSKVPIYYAINIALLGESGLGDDLIDWDVNEEDFTVKHIVDLTLSAGLLPTTTYTSVAGNFDLRVKYLICNNVQIQTQTIR